MKKSERKQDNKIIITGIIIGVIVIIVCIVGFFVVRSYVKDITSRDSQRQVSLSDKMKEELAENESTAAPVVTQEAVVTETAAPTSVVTVWPETQLQITEAPYSEEENTTPTYEAYEEVTATMSLASEVDMSGYSPVGIAYASATSTIEQEGYDNSAAMMFDGDISTSWQEGVEGTGTGESIYVTLDRTYSVRYITFKLGNWRSSETWLQNSRPSSLTVWIGGAGYQISFSDSMAEFCLAFSRDISASDLSITINGVYQAEHEDTCISEITIYGV